MQNPKSPSLPDVVTTVAELRDTVRAWHKAGLRVGLVPTMGSLHAGHLSLVSKIRESCDRVITSIFVNPTQFGAHEDFDAYPRHLDSDRAKLASVPCDLIYAPSAKQIYPDGFSSYIDVENLSENFEGTHRPGHFRGVATVVAKLILQAKADAAIFGEKDFQQLAVIQRMVRDLDIECEIMEGALVRESDGLAMSSRNAYLSQTERQIAGQFNHILRAMIDSLMAAKLSGAVLDEAALREAEEQAADGILAAGFDKVDYLSIVDPVTLETLKELDGPARVVSTARIRDVRLLDTMPIRAQISVKD